MGGPECVLLDRLVQRRVDVTELRQRLAVEFTALTAAILALRVGRPADIVFAELTHAVKDLVEPVPGGAEATAATEDPIAQERKSWLERAGKIK